MHSDKANLQYTPLHIVLVHSDKLSLSDMPPTHDLLVTLRILESADKYASTNRKNMRSRLWPEAHDGCSIKVEKVDKVKVGVCACACVCMGPSLGGWLP